MKLKLKVAAVAAASAVALTSFIAPANAATLAERPLSDVLNVANPAFDSNSKDFDILTAAILAVLAAKPDSAVKVLTTGSVALTAFIPTDEAFRKLVKDLTGKTLKKEANVFKAVAGLGIDTVEAVLLYHVTLGTIDFGTAKGVPAGTQLDTAQGGAFAVTVGTSITLSDKSPKLANPRVLIALTDLNIGNKQIAHGINRVLLPIALSPAHGK
jgi:uncharacterized surface protein with fasciclin (FAS1) repeats